ncbi:BspA family leucine-rich repeat surface protein [Mycoplasma yeatsii]|uniref:BspA family leucine-rich repeat surface protein n=1 Tax=Mycoplasma yeatsii TaxID=51365 RepID=UPI0005B23D8B|nr:BspA family leucine-rich repeat surface protein [Mycoplasma yeatsii]AJM71844.1 PARCEL domain-containing lipoprotein [Mycoplasma yeatsii GM274B]
MKKLLSIFTAIAMVATTSSVVGCKTEIKEEKNLSKLIVETDLGVIHNETISKEILKERIKWFNPNISDKVLSKIDLDISTFGAKVYLNYPEIQSEVEVKFIPVENEIDNGLDLNLGYVKNAVYNEKDPTICEEIGYFLNDKGRWAIEGFNKETKVVPDKLPWFITDLSQAFFQNKNKAIQGIENWDTSKVIDMNWMFKQAHEFNQDISKWDVSNVRDMSGMFGNAWKFNIDISSWDTKNLVNMSQMFADARLFNQNIGNWNTSNVTEMRSVFKEALVFNQNINTKEIQKADGSKYTAWDVSKVIDMADMFAETTDFNQPLDRWNTAKVTDMGYMFNQAKSFNQNISNWNVKKVRNWAGFSSNQQWSKDHQPKFNIPPQRNEID